MHCKAEFNRSLLQVAEKLYWQVTCFGRLGFVSKDGESAQTRAFFERVALVRAFLEMMQTVADLRFDDAEEPVCYNSALWPNGAAVSGYTSASSKARPTHMVNTYLGTWQLTWTGRRATGRLLRAAGWVWREEGFRRAVEYVLDLQHSGLALVPADVTGTLVTLSRLRAIVTNDREIGLALFGHEPGSSDAWLRSDFRDDLPEEGPANGEVVEALIDRCLSAVDETRDSTNYDDWFLGQHYLGDVIMSLRQTVSTHNEQAPVALKAVLAQLEEVGADAGAFISVNQLRAQRHPFCANFINAALLSRIFKKQAGDDWERRLSKERLVLPTALDRVYKEHDAPLPFEWMAVSPSLAPVLAIFTDHGPWCHWPRVVGNPLQGDPMVEGQPKDWGAEIQTGILASIDLTKDQRHKEAIERLESLHHAFPWSDLVLYELGVAFDEGGSSDDALERIETSIIVNPLNYMSWHSLGVILKKQGRMDEGLLAHCVARMIEQRSRPA